MARTEGKQREEDYGCSSRDKETCKLSTHIVRGVDVCAGCQQDLYDIRMPMKRRRVKWRIFLLHSKTRCQKDEKDA